MVDVVQIVEVGPRDGFQSVSKFIPTERKIALIAQLAAAGLTRIEVGSFVSRRLLPQMADVGEVLRAIRETASVRASVLVPNAKGARLALEAGVADLVYVLSASETHNQSNVRRSIDESFADLAAVIGELPADGVLRVNLATSFDCPYEGPVDEEHVLRIVERLLALRGGIEVCLCDTTGQAMPQHVSRLAERCRTGFGDAAVWAFHAHDTYGLGIANVLSAYHAGIRVFDASIAGLGGCPFAPGATGNVATEDVVFVLSKMGVCTGVDLQALLAAAGNAAAIEGANTGGHIRTVFSKTTCQT